MDELTFFQFTTGLFAGLCLVHMALDIPQLRKIGILKKTGKLETKKGTYTFTPKEKEE